jgi:hypothetical protein
MVLTHLLILSISISSLPLSLLHAHDHAQVCEVNSDTPLKFRIDKDASPVHLHEHQDDCYLCFQNHSSAIKQNIIGFQILEFSKSIKYFFITSDVQSVVIFYTLGRAPPQSMA